MTLQTFATEEDLALVNQKWEKLSPQFLGRMKRKGLLLYEVAKIWNKDSKLMRSLIFRYKSVDRGCLLIWSAIEKTVFDCALFKVTGYGGITGQYWASLEN